MLSMLMLHKRGIGKKEQINMATVDAQTSESHVPANQGIDMFISSTLQIVEVLALQSRGQESKILPYTKAQELVSLDVGALLSEASKNYVKTRIHYVKIHFRLIQEQNYKCQKGNLLYEKGAYTKPITTTKCLEISH